MKKNTFRKKTSLLLTAAASTVMAAQPMAINAAEGERLVLEEVIVSARKRDESLQDVPLSVAAFDPETLERSKIESVYDIATRVPGMQFNVSNMTDAEIFIRGIGSDVESAGADRAFGIFVDNVYMSRNTGSLVNLYDLERVEVLKGPQSLLFGKNIVGGLAHYVTKKPGEEFEASAEGTLGSYHRTDFSAAVRGPVAENVYAGLSAVSRQRDGFATNTATGADAEELDSSTIRAQLRFTPSEDLEILLSGDSTRIRNGARWVDVVTAGDSEALGFVPFILPDPEEGALPVPNLPGLPGFTLPNRNAPFVNADERRGPKNVDGFQHADLWGVSATVDFAINDSLNVTSITAYREADISIREDGGGLFFDFPLQQGTGIPDLSSVTGMTVLEYLAVVPDDYFDQRKTDDVDQFSQEIILQWDDGGALRWRAGLYYLNETIERSETVNHWFADFDYLIDVAFDLAFFGPGLIGSPDCVCGTSLADTESEATNLGVFGEVNYEFAENWSVNVGLRYAYDDKDFEMFKGGVIFDGQGLVGEDGETAVDFLDTGDSENWDAWLPSISVSYKAGDAATYYVRGARGYKPGGWNAENALSPQAARENFNEEFANSYELGGKYVLADNRVRLNIAAHFTEYE
ncbi:MAG: TonB-dependent receptor, partial [Pseudomonadales bacterium]